MIKEIPYRMLCVKQNKKSEHEKRPIPKVKKNQKRNKTENKIQKLIKTRKHELGNICGDDL